jgi:hypothetical protein
MPFSLSVADTWREHATFLLTGAARRAFVMRHGVLYALP